MRGRGIFAVALLLSACGARIVPPPATPSYRPPAGPARPPVPATPLPPVTATATPGAANAVSAGVIAGPAIYTLPIDDAAAARSLAAFRLSCPALLRRTDSSGLTRPADWQAACDAARGADPRAARAFFAQWFESAQIGDGRAFATGYYVPEIAGSRDRRKGFDTPIYGRPDDLVDVDLGQFSNDLKGRKIRGRIDGASFVPYFDRAAIEQGGLGRHAPIIAWAADPIEMFFLEVQGSGILRLPGGDAMRIGYASQNGHDYTGIGALMRQRGLLAPGQASMQGITQWLRDHPDQGRDIMRENKSFVFFRELDGPPLGALGLPVAARATVAADIRFVPLGAPVFLSMDRADASGLWVAQDTGGAIKGANRVDTFWGAGDEARAIAGGMTAHGTAFLLLPMGTLARLAAEGHGVGTTPQR
ncbi:murein transglycosylase A [Sphingomonas sp. RT2P30]|uniref:murein transglycosylase A n=1 Tax=Parasphingomonas halimpatiens TaxID=3096162 RepID=UPI002FC5F6CC